MEFKLNSNTRKMSAVVAKRPAQPSTLDMIVKAITTRHEARGSSVAGIKSTLQAMEFDTKKKNTLINSALKRGVATGVLKQVKGVGATGTFKIDTNSAKAAEKAKAQKEKERAKTAAKKQKEKEKKAAVREKAKAKKAAAKTKKPSPKAKKTTKPKKKTTKTPTKKAVVKKAVVKKAVKPKKTVKPKTSATKPKKTTKK
ncbi:histone H1.4-like [Apostichopus japonicus]|uniref:histone H1.4-like n=1 Tax=Stichopus japonicus TaxID=307972 RepID=UPI003AB566AC